MTGSPYGVTPGGTWPPPAGPPPLGPPPAPKQSRTLVIISLAVAVIAIAVAIGSWFRPTTDESPPAADPTPQYSEQKIAEAKGAICEAHEFVNRATQTAGSQTSDDPSLRASISLNIRIGSTLSANYLLAKLDQYPATPAELADSARALAMAYQETTLSHLSDAPESELNNVYERLDSTDAKVIQACK
jgi:hypothetical protein